MLAALSRPMVLAPELAILLRQRPFTMFLAKTEHSEIPFGLALSNPISAIWKGHQVGVGTHLTVLS